MIVIILCCVFTPNFVCRIINKNLHVSFGLRLSYHVHLCISIVYAIHISRICAAACISTQSKHLFTLVRTHGSRIVIIYVWKLEMFALSIIELNNWHCRCCVRPNLWQQCYLTPTIRHIQLRVLYHPMSRRLLTHASIYVITLSILCIYSIHFELFRVCVLRVDRICIPIIGLA